MKPEVQQATGSTPFPRKYKLGTPTDDWTHLEAASRAELFDDADVGWVYAGADEAVEVVVRDLLHLKQFLLDGAVHLYVLLAQVLLDDRRALVRDERDVGASVAALLADAAAREVRQVAAVYLAL